MLHKKLALIVLAWLFLIGITLFFVGKVFASNVSDTGNGTKGYILVNTDNKHQGVWTDPSFLKGEKGDKGDKGEQGLQGFNGLNGKDVDPTTVTNLQNTDQTLQNNINIETTTRENGDNLLQNNINMEALSRTSVETNSIDRDKVLQTNINNVNDRVNDVEHRVSRLERTQYVLRGEVKFIREKHLEVGVYSEYNVGRSACSEVGVNVVIPIGESYQDRENKKIITRLTALEQKVGTATVIERTLDNKGKVKSISISQGQIAVNGEF